MKINMKDPINKLLVSMTIIVISLCAAVAAEYALYRITEGRPVDYTIFYDENEARIKDNLKDYNSFTGIVSSYGVSEFNSINLRTPDDEYARLIAYLSDKDIINVNIGDIITVRGKLTYDDWPNSEKYFLFCGSIFRPAKVVKIEREGEIIQ